MGQADIQREGPLKLPNLMALGLGNAIELACGLRAPGIDPSSGNGAWQAKHPAGKIRHQAIGNWRGPRSGIGII